MIPLSAIFVMQERFEIYTLDFVLGDNAYLDLKNQGKM